jgi:cell wall-associated NlpC family hydrolase
MPWTDDYIDLIFLKDGRDRLTGVDCWGLCRLPYMDRLGIVLPDKAGIYTDESPETRKRIAAAMDEEARSWMQVERPQEYDLVLMRRGELHCHVGIYDGSGNMLHICAGINSTVEPINCLRWRHRIVGFFRYVP